MTRDPCCNAYRTRALRGRRGASTARASCARVGSNRRPPQSSSAGSGRPHSTVGRWKSGSSRHSSGGSNGGGVASGCLVEPMSAHSTARSRARALGTTETPETRSRSAVRRELLMGFWCSGVLQSTGPALPTGRGARGSVFASLRAALSAGNPRGCSLHPGLGGTAIPSRLGGTAILPVCGVEHGSPCPVSMPARRR